VKSPQSGLPAPFPAASSRPVALVTGSQGRLGQVLCRRLAGEGYRLVLHARRILPGLQKLGRELESMGAETRLAPFDLAQTSRIGAWGLKAGAAWGRLDLLVNGASEFKPTPRGGRPGDWERMTKINAMAPYFLSRALGPLLAKHRGSIVNLVDTYADHPILPDHPAYLASKAALAALTRVLALELAPEVRVNGVSPGAVTFPESYSRNRRMALAQKSLLRRAGSPGDIAEAVLYLAGADFTTGEILRVDGGRFI
jgi:pteridine reductase